MWTRDQILCWFACLMMCLTVTGCERLHKARIPGLESFIDFGTHERQKEQYRRRYHSQRDHQAIRWLLANRVEQGMTLADVNRIFGEQGEREFDDQKFKIGSTYRATDIAYRWGPDATGRTVYLLFRDGQLVNFDPNEFRD